MTPKIVSPEGPANRGIQRLGWREWLALPELGIPRIKAKVDTGARTSCLHAFFVETFRKDQRDRVRFGVHPLQLRADSLVICETDLLDRRIVTDSGGHRERRCIIATEIVIGSRRKRIELTLADRDTMRFRMLLGRTSLKGDYLVDPGRSYLSGMPEVVGG
jgi:hypothetical protein